MKQFILFIVSVLFACSLYAQEVTQGFEDVVYLKDGSVLRGVIEAYEPDGEIRIKSWNGTLMTFSSDDVKRIEQIATNKKKGKKDRIYQFKERGIFNSTDFYFTTGRTAWDEVYVGPSLQNVTGFQFNRLAGVGLGLGVNAISPGEGEVIVPLFLEARGYLYERRVTPMYRFDLGYGFATKNENANIVDAKGGIMVHPSFGFRFGARSTSNVTLDFGYFFQKATFIRERWNETLTREMKYKRYTVRVGLLF